MKTLYCIIGNLRSGDAPCDSYQKNIHSEDVDIALYTGNDYKDSPWRSLAKYTWETDESTNWWEDVYDARLTGWRNWNPTGNTYGPYVKTLCNGDMRDGSGMIVSAYRQLLYGKLLEIPHYDRYILSRSDIMFINKKIDIPRTQPNTIYVPKGEEWGGVTDRFMVSDRDAFLKSLLVMDTLEKMQSNHPTNFETLLLKHFINSNLKVQKIPRFMFSIAKKGDQTRWQPPCLECSIPEYPGYYAKYRSEYYMAIQ